MDSRDLKELINQARKGDKSAFENLYNMYIRNITFLTGNLLFDKNRTEDVVQNIVIKMYRHISSLKNPEAFRSWMQRIVNNECIRENEKTSRNKSENIDDYIDILESNDEDILPEEAAEKSLTGELVMDIINRLPKARRQAMIMHYYDDMSYPEIASALGITASTVSTNILRAKETIKKEMENQMNYTEKSGIALKDSAITAVIAGEAKAMYPDTYCEELTTKINAKIDLISPRHEFFTSGKLKFVIGFLASIIVIASIWVATGTDVVPGEKTQIIKGEAYQPEALIVFEDENRGEGNKNPTRAILESEDGGEALGWSIASLAAPDQELKRGEGFVADDFSGLPEGEYRIQWQVQNDKGSAATVIRNFIIETNS